MLLNIVHPLILAHATALSAILYDKIYQGQIELVRRPFFGDSISSVYYIQSWPIETLRQYKSIM